jgi:uncharacterized protein YfaS (alpha-2-macroglobulin family)
MRKNAMDFLFKGLQDGVYGLNEDATDYEWDYLYSGRGRFSALAYGAFVLSRRQQAPVSALRKLYEVRKQARSGLDLVRLGIAFHLMGDDKRAQTLIDESFSVPSNDGDWWIDSYDSELSDSAMMYTLIQRYQMKAKNPGELLLALAKDLNHRQYLSTQEQFAVFLAGREIVEGDASSKDASWGLTATAKSRANWKASAGASQSVIEIQAADLKRGVEFRNTGGKKLYAALSVEGNDAKMPKATNDNLSVGRYIYDAEGNLLGGRELKVGESAIIEVFARSKMHLRNALVVDKIPAGLEIENTNIVDGEGLQTPKAIDGVMPADAMKDPNIEHVEYRDDRFVAAVNLDANDYSDHPIKLFYRVKAVTPGVYVFPQSYCEDMYRPEIFAVGDPEKKFEVKERGK